MSGGGSVREAGEGHMLRAAVAADRAFLRRVYGSTRAEELALTGWSAAETRAFLDQQFDAQDRFYREHFADARFDVIERDGRPVGRLYVDRRPEEIRVIDIALLSEERGAGLGGILMRGLLDEAAAAGKSVTIHVERNNPALRFYHRLGFAEIEDQGVYLLLRWSPTGSEPEPIR